MWRIIGLAWGLFWSVPAALFGLIWYGSYWSLRSCFNEQGRCFDPVTSTVEHDSNFIWILPAILCLVLALPGFVVAWCTGKRRAAA